MIELYQFPYSPFVIVQRRILEFAGVKFKSIRVPYHDRSSIWKLTRQRYYQVPVLRDGKQVLFETGDDTQIIAKYLDDKLELGLFPHHFRGLQNILWRHIENDIEGLGFKLNDIYYEEVLSKSEILGFVRHKERKFGRGCLDRWRESKATMVAELGEKLVPFEQMLLERPFLLDQRPRFVDFDLYGILGNFLYSGHYELPAAHTQLRAWHSRMAKIKLADLA